MNHEIFLLKSRVFHTGGVEKHAFRLAKAFHERGMKVTLLTTGEVPPHKHPFSILSLCPHNGFGAYLLTKFDRLVKEYLGQHPDAVVFGLDRNTLQTHYRAGNGVHAEYLRLRARVEPWWRTATFSVNPLHLTILSLERRLFASTTLKSIITNSNMVKDEIIAHYDVDPKKIVCIHNGVEWKEYQQPFDMTFQQRDSIRKAWKIPLDAFLFLFVGNGYRRKGLHYLIEGLASLDRPDLHLAVVGHDKALSDFLRQAKRLGLSRRTHFFGQQNNLFPFYQASDVLAIPSLYDPFANVTVEALAMGLYVVSSPNNGGSEILNPSSGCVIGNLFDKDLVAQALQIALRHPKTPTSAREIRTTVRHLDLTHQQALVVREIIPC